MRGSLVLVCSFVLAMGVAPPLHELHMFRNNEYRKRLSGSQAKEEHAFLKHQFPNTQRAAWETVWIPQPALLGDEQDMHEIVAAIAKIQKSAKEDRKSVV